MLVCICVFFVTFLTAKSEYFLAGRKGICVQVLMKCSYETNFTLTVPEFLSRVVYTGDALSRVFCFIDCGLFGKRESRKSDGSSSIVASRVRFSTYGSLNKLRSNAPAVFGL